MHAFLDYRRWAFESAALDLALRQAGRSLGDAVGREPDPSRSSPLAGWRSPSTARLRPSSSSTRGSASSSTRGRTGARRSSPSWRHWVRRLDRPEGPVLRHRRRQPAGSGALPRGDRAVPGGVARGSCAHAGDRGAARAACRPCDLGCADPLGRRHRGASLATQDRQREAVTVRFRRAALRGVRLLRGHEIGAYGGGQWELGVGRGHIQLLAALFHPTTPNDVAPGGFNATEPPTDLPASPLTVTERATGFQPG